MLTQSKKKKLEIILRFYCFFILGKKISRNVDIYWSKNCPALVLDIPGLTSVSHQDFKKISEKIIEYGYDRAVTKYLEEKEVTTIQWWNISTSGGGPDGGEELKFEKVC